MSALAIASLATVLLPAPSGDLHHVLAGGATLPPGFVDVVVDNGLTEPTAMELAPDGRLFVAEQGGALRVIKSGTLLLQPFVTLDVDSTGERGLLGVAFDPNFTNNGYVYVYYTATSPTVHNRVSRFTANGDVAVPGSEQILLELPTLGPPQHNGGAVHFGIDGKLYIGVGENGTGANAQSLSTPLGKLLRINPNGSIPSDNPFYSLTTGSNRAIWALGLRNPFTFAVQPGAGRIFINDVGAKAWEEINDGVAGANYGWPATEGYTSDPDYVSPLYAYAHGSGSAQGCAITGGTFYNPSVVQFPSSYVGDYFFADFCNGWIRRYDPATDTATGFATGIGMPVDLDVGPDGTLYYLAMEEGAVHAIRYQEQDSDRDGCTDQQELAADPGLGGARDPNNFWDFFDVDTENGLGAGTALFGVVVVNDITRVVLHFGQTGDPTIPPLTDASSFSAYHTRFDRTIVGPNAWNLGPPNGAIVVDDIAHVVRQFGHHCT